MEPKNDRSLLEKFKYGYDKSVGFVKKVTKAVKGIRKLPIVGKAFDAGVAKIDEAAPFIREGVESAQAVGEAISEIAPAVTEAAGAIGEAASFEIPLVGEAVALFKADQWIGNKFAEMEHRNIEPRTHHTRDGESMRHAVQRSRNGPATPAQRYNGTTSSGNNPNSTRPPIDGDRRIKRQKVTHTLQGPQPPVMSPSTQPHQVNTEAHPTPSRGDPTQTFGSQPVDPGYPLMRGDPTHTGPVLQRSTPFSGAQHTGVSHQVDPASYTPKPQNTPIAPHRGAGNPAP